MRTRRSVAGLVVAIAAAGCVADGSPPEMAPAEPPRDARLRDDCGDFIPSPPLLDIASGLHDPSRRANTLATLAQVPAAERVEILRAGLRLRDDAAARSCAARLTWKQIDRWECARCVDLLVEDVLRPGSEADFEEFRSYVGSVELPQLLHSLPPQPWAVAPDRAIGALHRISMSWHIPSYLEVTRNPDADIADAAWSNIGLLSGWSDEFRDEIAAAGLAASEVPFDATARAEGSGLSPVLAASLRWDHLRERFDGPKRWKITVSSARLRQLWSCTPGPRDADLLMALTEHDDEGTGWQDITGVAYLLLGRLSDPKTEAFLRSMTQDTEQHFPVQFAIWALARRGDKAMLERVVEDAKEHDQFALALLMEVDPARARRFIEDTLFGADDAAANETFDALGDFAVPGAWYEPLGFDWRRTSFDGFEREAIDADLPPARLARIGLTVPGCRTRTLAAAVVRGLKPADLDGMSDEVGAFLETAVPAEFSQALRVIRQTRGDGAGRATSWLVAMGDAQTAAAVLESAGDTDWPLIDLARSRAPEVRRFLAERVRAGSAAELSKEERDEWDESVQALAVADGFPERAAWALVSSPEPLPRDAVEAIQEGRPIDALAAVLAARPDEMHHDVGSVDDPSVRAYLARLRKRRDLELYWYATGQLAVLGDTGARAEWWGAMQDGRYRIIDEADYFDRTLGFDVAATMPFWIDQLRSQCCRIVTGGGDIVEDVLGLDQGCFQSPWRTSYRRAKEWWDAAGGRFVRSGILSGNSYRPRFVPEPR